MRSFEKQNSEELAIVPGTICACWDNLLNSGGDSDFLSKCFDISKLFPCFKVHVNKKIRSLGETSLVLLYFQIRQSKHLPHTAFRTCAELTRRKQRSLENGS